MDINELYRWRFCLFVNDKLHNRFDSLDFIYSNNLDELKNSYPDYFNEYKLDGLLSPECYAGDKELSLISHNYNVNYKDIPVYYAVLERNSETEYQDNKIIVDRGIAYKSRHYAAGMQRSLYNNFRTYWRCISDDKDVKPYQCCLIHKSIYEWEPKICAGRTESTYKIYDHDYNVYHCTEFEPNRDYGEFFKNRIMVMSTEKKLLDDYIAFYTDDRIHKLESLIEKIKVTIKKIKKN